MSLSSPRAYRSWLETQIREVYVATGKPLNEIRTDLEYTGDTQKTIDRIHNGKFLKGIPRDPSFKARLSKSHMAPKSPPLGPTRTDYGGIKKRDGKGKGIAKAIPLKCEVIDLCDSGDEAPSTAQGFGGPSKFRPAMDFSSATAGYSLLGPSSAILPKAHTNSTVMSKQGNMKPSVPRYETPPLFRYCPSSASPSPPPPPPPPPPLPPPLQASPVNKRPHSSVAPPRLESPAAITPPSNKKQKTIHIISLVDDDESDLELVTLPYKPAAASPITQKKSRLSATTRALLQEFADYSEDDSDSDLGGTSKSVPKKKGLTAGGRTVPVAKQKMKDVSVEGYDRDDEENNSTARASKRNNRLSETEKARRAAEKEEIRLSKQQERELKAAEKEEMMAQKKREKEAKEVERKREQELASVNKPRTSKKDSAPEMIVDISIDLAASVIGDQLRRFMLGLGCEVNHEWHPVTVGDGLCRVVKWRRNVKADYNEEKGMFLPLPIEQVRDEQHVLVYLTAKEFLEISMGAAGCDRLAEHVSRIKRLHPGREEDVKLIYLIEGLDALARKNKSNRNRQYQNRVRAQLGSGEGSNSTTGADIIDDDQIEDARLRLQIVHGCLIHETSAAVESMEWISKFTGDISTIPYKKSRMVADTAFCTDVGQVKTGLGKADTYSRMLEEIHRVTPSVANGVASEYPDVPALVNAFRLHGEDAVEDLPNIATRDGLPMSRTIGTACSRRIYGIFMGMDPFSTDV